VGEKFVSAVSLAGYEVELAGGGQHSEAQFRSRVQALTATLPAGTGIWINILFLNPV
jgi:enoyl reductase-like protein